MTDWRVVVPIKQGGDGKSRLGSLMGEGARSDLSQRMAAHVLEIVTGHFDLSLITIVSPHRPETWDGQWMRDQRRGLNPELEAWRNVLGDKPFLIIHADLPLLAPDDVRAIIETAAEHGAALATDRSGQGTNALAIADGRPFTLLFGPDSCALHCAQFPDMPVLQREGLMADLDTPDDASFICARGFAI